MHDGEFLEPRWEEEEEEVLDYTYSIASYGADYPVDSIVQRLQKGTVVVPAFQREYVWDIKRASRFIESLLLGLPIPGIFLAKDNDTSKLLVIDGQQRLRSLEFFYKGVFNDRVFRLRDVQKRFEGKTYSTLEIDDRVRLDDAIVHATIIKQEAPTDDYSSVFMIFERLNTGGMQLQPQEIRTAIFAGDFIGLLKELNNEENWREIFGPKDKRLKDQEFILRFLALFFSLKHYKKPLKGFLNAFMKNNRHLNVHSRDEITNLFCGVIKLINESLGISAFRPKKLFNASIFDSVMIGIATRMMQNGAAIDRDKLKAKYDQLLSTSDYIELTSKSTSDEVVVAKRISLAIDTFKDI